MAGTLYLASASPRRSQLLRQAGFDFEQLAVPVDEERLTANYGGPLELLGEYLARQKALAAYGSLKGNAHEALVLASDTTVLLDGRSLPKPRDLAEAAEMLGFLRGREHIVATGVALAGPGPRGLVSGTSATRVLMRSYGDEEIATYLSTGDPLDKAGAYSIQHPDFHPVASIEGCHLGVIGLPLCLVGALLGRWPVATDTVFAGRGQLQPCPWSAQCRAPLPAAAALRQITSRSTQSS